MLKKLVNPMQMVLLQKKFCPGCTRKLDSQKDRKSTAGTNEQVTCECGRIFVYEKETDTYRRASVEEVR